MSELWSKSFGTLRWIRRDGELVLQELWMQVFTGEKDWRDVPIVENAESDAEMKGNEPRETKGG